MILEGIRIG